MRTVTRVGVALMSLVGTAVATACSSDSATTGGTLPTIGGVAVWRDVPPALDDADGASVTPDVESALESAPDSFEVEVRSAFDWLMFGRAQCGRQPSRCVIDDLAMVDSPVHRALQTTMNDRVRHGIVASDRGSHRFRVSNVTMIGDDRAEIRACHTDDVVLVITGVAGRPPGVFDESLVSHWSTWTLRRTDAGWRWVDEIVDRRIHGEDVCS